MAQKKLARSSRSTKPQNASTIDHPLPKSELLRIEFSLEDLDGLNAAVERITTLNNLMLHNDDEEIRGLGSLIESSVETLQEVADHINGSWEEACIAREEGGAQ